MGNLLCCVSEHFRFRKFMDEIGGVAGFSVEFSCLRVPKNFVEGPFCAVFQKISGSEKVYG